MLLRKQVFCYSYVNSQERLRETSLPAKEFFFDKLTESSISDEDFHHAQLVFKTLGFESIGQYSALYLSLDICLLIDLFQNFRELSLSNFGLDPLHYYTLPSLSLSAALKLTKIRLELISCPELYLWFENMIRGKQSSLS